jgi:hypothetical protein
MNMSSVPAAASATNIRDRFLGFIDRHEVAWELTFATLAIVYVIVGFVDESAVTTGIEATLTAVFVAEFTTRIAASYDSYPDHPGLARRAATAAVAPSFEPLPASTVR